MGELLKVGGYALFVLMGYIFFDRGRLQVDLDFYKVTVMLALSLGMILAGYVGGIAEQLTKMNDRRDADSQSKE